MVPDCHNGYARINILLCSCQLVVVVSCHKLCCCTYCCLPCNSWPNCEQSLPAVGPHYSVWVKACTSCWRTCVLFLGAAPCTWWSSAIVLSCCLKRCGAVLHVWCFRGTAMFFLDIVLGEALWLSNALGFLHFWWMKFTVPVFERACSGHASHLYRLTSSMNRRGVALLSGCCKEPEPFLPWPDNWALLVAIVQYFSWCPAPLAFALDLIF